jgi:hypothetical protein
MRPGRKRFTLDLPASDHRELKSRAAQLGLTMADVLRELIAHWLRGDIFIEFEEPQQDEPRKTAP